MQRLDSEELRGIGIGRYGPFPRRWQRAHDTDDIDFQPDLRQKIVQDPTFQGDAGIIYQSAPEEVTVANGVGDQHLPEERAVTRKAFNKLQRSTGIRVRVFEI